jgi:hypothetical protein
VRAEIQQHYDSACEAGDDAIAALGNPRAANRAYRKVLLTEREAMMAPALTQRKRPSLSVILQNAALMAAFAWWMSGKHQIPGFWPIMIAISCTTPLNWFFPPTTLERSRIYAYLAGVRFILVVAIAWWYQAWIIALPLGAVCFLLDYFLDGHRLSVFRKLAAGQTYSLLPEEPQLTHREALMLRTLDREPDSSEKVASTVLLMMVAGMAAWLPATFVPMAVFVVAGHLTRRSVPFRTEERSRRFRIAKWAAMVVAAVLPVLLRARIPWGGAFFLALLFVLFDLTSISIRRKLPVAQWPKRLYW